MLVENFDCIIRHTGGLVFTLHGVVACGIMLNDLKLGVEPVYDASIIFMKVNCFLDQLYTINIYIQCCKIYYTYAYKNYIDWMSFKNDVTASTNDTCIHCICPEPSPIHSTSKLND